MCKILGIARSAYYKWLGRESPESEIENEKIAELVKVIHSEDQTKGYRRIKDDLLRNYGLNINDKRILRICRAIGVNGKIKCTDFRHQECTLSRQELLSFSPQSAHFHHSW